MTMKGRPYRDPCSNASIRRAPKRRSTLTDERSSPETQRSVNLESAREGNTSTFGVSRLSNVGSRTRRRPISMAEAEWGPFCCGRAKRESDLSDPRSRGHVQGPRWVAFFDALGSRCEAEKVAGLASKYHPAAKFPGPDEKRFRSATSLTPETPPRDRAGLVTKVRFEHGLRRAERRGKADWITSRPRQELCQAR